MSTSYTWVQWNRHKKVYDALLAAGVAVYFALFIAISSLVLTGDHAVSMMTMLIRATGTCAILMLHLVLMIGPLHRLDPRFAPLLYNRRHFGVMLFFVALLHGLLVLIWYGAFGLVNPVKAMLAMNMRYDSLTGFPFEVLGMFALAILFLMAATSHDFWLKNLSPRWWKSLHMLVYAAYGALVLHVVLGVMQTERSPAYPVVLGAGFILVFGLHITAGLRAWRDDRRVAIASPETGWVDAGSANDIPEDRAKILMLKDGQRIAVFRYNGCVSAVANVCAHQGGPLGEGKVVDGCITCPWHGYQYRPADGQSPPPFTEKIPTYDLRIDGGRVLVNPDPNAPGTAVPPARIGGQDDA